MRLQKLFFKEVEKHCSKVDEVTLDCHYANSEESVDFWVWENGNIIASALVQNTRKKTHKQQVEEAIKKCVTDSRMK